MTTYYLDFEGGTDGNTGLDFAQRRKTLGAFSASDLAPGDTVRIMASPAVTSLGQTATWTDLSPTVTLNAAVTANISLCQAAWTASANVTAATSSTRKEGTVSTSVALAAGFGTGLAAYEATGLLDLSGYQQISFWIRQSSGTLGAAGAVTLELCSDAIGAVSVASISIPAIPATAQWFCVTVNTGGALPAVVNSVALYVTTDNGAQTFLIDNIIACKAAASADSLTLNSLIGKNADDGLWWPIRSINGTTVTIDMDVNSSNATASLGYVGTTETVAAYKREPILPTSTNATFATVNDSGTSGLPITLSGGWNRTDMSTQTGETWVSNAFGGLSVGLSLSTMNFVTCEKLSWVRYGTCVSLTTGSNITFGATCNALGGATRNVLFSGAPSQGQTVPCDFGYAYCSGIGIQDGTSPVGRLWGTIQGVFSCSTTGIDFQGGTSTVCDVVNAKNNGVGLGFSSTCSEADVSATNVTSNATGLSFVAGAQRCRVRGATLSGNTTADVVAASRSIHDLFNCSLGSATPFLALTAGGGGRIRSTKHGQTANNHYIWDHLGVIQSEATVRHTASDIAWRVSPTTTVAVANAPLTLAIAHVACAASELVTVKAWMRRSNTGLTMKLVCRGGQIGGVASDVSASMAAAADTWEELTITFTPSEAGVVKIEAQAYGATTYSGYVDDLTITQA